MKKAKKSHYASMGDSGSPFVRMDPFGECCSVQTVTKTDDGEEIGGHSPFMCNRCGRGWFKNKHGAFVALRGFVEAVPEHWGYRNGQWVRKIL